MLSCWLWRTSTTSAMSSAWISGADIGTRRIVLSPVMVFLSTGHHGRLDCSARETQRLLECFGARGNMERLTDALGMRVDRPGISNNSNRERDVELPADPLPERMSAPSVAAVPHRVWNRSKAKVPQQ